MSVCPSVRKSSTEDELPRGVAAAGTFTVPGDGDVDFTSIFQTLADNDYKGWVVVEAEQDPAKPIRLSMHSKPANTSVRRTGL